MSDLIDQAEGILVQGPLLELPVKHIFTEGIYVRELFIPAGVWLTSKIHLTEHPFFLSKGRVAVYVGGDEAVQVLEAPYCGITKPGTRRIIHAQEDSVWTTVHANPDNERDPLKIEARIIEPHDNPYLAEDIKELFNLNGIKNIES